MYLSCVQTMIEAAPVMKPEMTACERKLTIQPRRKRPMQVYMRPARKEIWIAPRLKRSCRSAWYASFGSEGLTWNSPKMPVSPEPRRSEVTATGPTETWREEPSAP